MSQPTQRTAPVLLAVLLGAALGLAVGAGAYLLVNPVVEGAAGWVEELQGLLWNVVPLGALVGALLGYAAAARRASRDRR